MVNQSENFYFDSRSSIEDNYKNINHWYIMTIWWEILREYYDNL